MSGGTRPFVNETGGDKGLQFPNQGIKIKLPAPKTHVRLIIGQFSQPIDVKLVDTGGAVVAAAVINAPNTMDTLAQAMVYTKAPSST